jgi:hypothetical protein
MEIVGLRKLYSKSEMEIDKIKTCVMYLYG